MDHKVTLKKLLRDACVHPERLAAGYAAFSRFSLRNQVLAMRQCAQRKLEAGPLATAEEWLERDAEIRPGERPLALCQVQISGIPETPGAGLTFENRWFLRSQTTARAEAEPPVPSWSAAEALARLGIVRLAFTAVGPSDTGYSFQRYVAVHPRTEHREKILLHEVAHIRLGHSALVERRHRETLPQEREEVAAEAVALLVAGALGFPGAASNAEAIRRALDGKLLDEQDALAVFTTADEILLAGRFAGFPKPGGPQGRHKPGARPNRPQRGAPAMGRQPVSDLFLSSIEDLEENQRARQRSEGEIRATLLELEAAVARLRREHDDGARSGERTK